MGYQVGRAWQGSQLGSPFQQMSASPCLSPCFRPLAGTPVLLEPRFSQESWEDGLVMGRGQGEGRKTRGQRERGKDTKTEREGDPSTKKTRMGEWDREIQRPGGRGRKTEQHLLGRHSRHSGKAERYSQTSPSGSWQGSGSGSRCLRAGHSKPPLWKKEEPRPGGLSLARSVDHSFVPICISILPPAIPTFIKLPFELHLSFPSASSSLADAQALHTHLQADL